MKKVPLIMQMNAGENGAAALSMILAYYKKFVPISEVREQCVSSRNTTTVSQLCKAAEHYQLETVCEECTDTEKLRKLKYPVIAQWNKRYYAIICGVGRKTVRLCDPARGQYNITIESFWKRFGGTILRIRPGAEFHPSGKPDSMPEILWNHMKGNGGVFGKVILIRGMATAAVIITVLLSRSIMDEIMSKGEKRLILPFLLALAFLVLCRIIMSVGETLYILKESRRMTAQSAVNLYKTILMQPMHFFEERFSGDLVHRMDANTYLNYTILQKLTPRAIDFASAIFYIALMFYYNVPITCMILGVEAIYALANHLLNKKISTVSRSISTAESAANSRTLHGMDMMETIKITGAEHAYFTSWIDSQNAFDEGKYKLIRLYTLSGFMTNLRNYLSSALLLFAGVFFIINGFFTMGLLSLYMTVVQNMQNNMEQMTDIMKELQLVRTDIERVDDILQMKTMPEIELGETVPEKIKGDICIKDVCFSYGLNDRAILENFNLKIGKGESVAIVGKTGCGKSTLLKLLTGLYQPESGEILYDGKSLSEIPTAIAHASIASADQEIMMFADSAGNNIRLWDELIEDYEMIHAAKDAQIHSVIADSHGGYESRIVEHGRNYSGGELQRIELARALAKEPTVLILDEFTSALDAITEEKVFQAIMKRGITCVIAAHRLSTVMLCDRVIVMNHGKIMEEGAPLQLYNQGGWFTRLMEDA